MNTNVQNNNQHNNLIKYFPNGDVQIKLDNILTPNQILRENELLLKVEGQHFDNIQLLNVRDQDGMVYLQIKDLKTERVHEISQRLDPENGYFVWWVVSYEFIVHAIADHEINQDKGKDLLEFEF